MDPTGPQEGDNMVQKPHYIRNMLKTPRKIEPREKELREGGMVFMS